MVETISSEGDGCRVPMVVAMGRTSAHGTAVVRFDAPAGPRSVPPGVASHGFPYTLPERELEYIDQVCGTTTICVYSIRFLERLFGWSPGGFIGALVSLDSSIRTDTHSEINIQVAFPRDIIGKEILIPRGTPFAWYIPYKRESLGLQKIDYDHNMTAANEYGYYSKFRDGYKTHAKIKDKKD